MAEVFGTRDKCIYCNKKGVTQAREVVFKPKKGPDEMMYVCSEPCEKDLMGFLDLVETKRTLFITVVIVWLGVTVIAAILALTLYRHLMHLVSLATIGFGIALLFMPFVTPQTIELMGVKKGTVLGRISGVVLILVGLGLSILFLIVQPKG